MHDRDRQEAIAAADRLAVAMQTVVDVFSTERRSIDVLLHILQGPRTLTEALSQFDFAAERSRLTDTLDQFEKARREARIAAWRLMASEGCSIGEMGRIFGLSRQLISRQLRDAGVDVTALAEAAGHSET